MAALVLAIIIFFAPFACLFLPREFAMDRDYSHPYLAYTTPIAFAAPFFFYVPMLIWDGLRPLNYLWFYVFAFIQSLLLMLLTLCALRALLRSRWRQLTSRTPNEPNVA